MKHMKMAILWIALMVSNFGFAAGVPSTNRDESINSLAVAQKLMRGISRYEFWLTHMTAAGTDTLTGWLDLKGQVHELCINDVQILGEGETLPGIPFPKVGSMANAGMNIAAKNSDGQTIGHGWFWKDLLVAGDPIVVIIDSFYHEMRFLDVDGGQNGDQVVIDGLNVGSWSEYYQQYVIWVNPTRSLTEHDYQIYSADGILIGGGRMDPAYRLIYPNGDRFVFTTVKFAGNVVYTSPELPSVYGIHRIDSLVSLGTMISEPAKVFVVNGSSGARAYFKGNFTEALAYVERDGEMILVGQILPSQNWDEWVNLALPGEHVTLVVRGGQESDFEFFVDFGDGKG